MRDGKEVAALKNPPEKERVLHRLVLTEADGVPVRLRGLAAERCGREFQRKAAAAEPVFRHDHA